MLKFENYLYNTRSERNQVLAEAIIGDKNKRETIGFDQEDIDWLQNNFPYQLYATAMFKRWQYLKEFLIARDAAREEQIEKMKSDANQSWLLKTTEQEAEQVMKKKHPNMREDLKKAFIDYYVKTKYIMNAAKQVDKKFTEEYAEKHKKDLYDFKNFKNFPKEFSKKFYVDSRIPELVRKYEGELGSANGIDLGGVSTKSLGTAPRTKHQEDSELGFQTRGGSFPNKDVVEKQVKNWIAASATGMLTHKHSPEKITGHIEVEDPYTLDWHENNVKYDIDNALKKSDPGKDYDPLNDDQKTKANIEAIRSFVSDPKILNYLQLSETEIGPLVDLGAKAFSNSAIEWLKNFKKAHNREEIIKIIIDNDLLS